MRKLLRFLCLVLVAGLLLGIISADGAVSAAEIASLSLAKLLSSGEIKALGRTQVGGSGILADWSGSGFEINVTAHGGDFTVGYKASYSSYWSVLVDGEEVWRGLAEAGTGTFTAPIPAGEHTVSVVKETQISSGASAYCDLTTVSFAGTVNAAPAKKKLYIEFVGDSIACGDGALGTYEPGVKWQAQDDSATHSFPWYTARAVDADYSIVARGGIGLLKGYSVQEGTKNVVTMGDIYAYTSGYRTAAGAYGFSRKPDVVVIELGANDGTSDPDSWALKLKEMVKQVRARNGSAAKIIYMGSNTLQYNEALALQASLGDGNFYVYHYYRNGSGSAALATQLEGHPSAEDQRNIAEGLVAFMKSQGILASSEKTAWRDINYYVSQNGSNNNSGRSIASAKKSMSSLISKVLEDNGGLTVFPNGSRLVIYMQGTVSNSGQAIITATHLTREDGSALPILVTTYKFDGTNKATLASGHKPHDDGNSSLKCYNDITFKNISFTSATNNDSLFRDNKLYSGMNSIVFDNVTFGFTGAQPTNNTGWQISAGDFVAFDRESEDKQYYASVTFKNGDYTNLEYATTCAVKSLWSADAEKIIRDAPYIHASVIIEAGAHMGTVYGIVGIMPIGDATVEIRGGIVDQYRGTADGTEKKTVTYTGTLNTVISGGTVQGSFYGVGDYVNFEGNITNTITGGEIRCTPNQRGGGIYLAGGSGSSVGSVTNIITGGSLNVVCRKKAACGIYFGAASGSVIRENLTNLVSGGTFAMLPGGEEPDSCGIYFGSQNGSIAGTLRNEISGGCFDLSAVGMGGYYLGGDNGGCQIGRIVNILGTEGSDNGPRFLGSVIPTVLGGAGGAIGLEGDTGAAVISNTIYNAAFQGTVFGGCELGSGSCIYGSVENTVYNGKFMGDLLCGSRSTEIQGSVTTVIHNGIFSSINGGSGSGIIGDGVSLTIHGMRDYTAAVGEKADDWYIAGGSGKGDISKPVTEGKPAVYLHICPTALLTTAMDIIGGSISGNIEGDVTAELCGGKFSGVLYHGSSNGGITGNVSTRIYGGDFPAGIVVKNSSVAALLAPGRYLSAGGSEIALMPTQDAVLEELSVESKAITEESLTVTLTGVEKARFDGTEKKPEITVSVDGKVLTEGTDYTVAYSRDGAETDDLINVGTVTVTVSVRSDAHNTVTTRTGYEIRAKSVLPWILSGVGAAAAAAVAVILIVKGKKKKEI
ncbi:MAG: hypothetical protein J6L24_04285 [Oscillospiraceae bacterium]|nr:hypothetical protein [Oscillospiraceae bacterium]